MYSIGELNIVQINDSMSVALKRYFTSLDQMTSETSCTPYNATELASFVKLAAEIKGG